MTYVSHSSTFARTEALPFDRLISRLHSASKYPLRITCFGVATFIDDDPDAAGTDYWLGWLRGKGQQRTFQMWTRVLSSPEAFARAQQQPTPS